MNDKRREQLIKAYGVMLRYAMAHGYRRTARVLHKPWLHLINGRSQAQVQRMETEQGLSAN